ncbi:hypothetical protein [Streptosporangium sp. KLBMP 9127]|nr:hypothetical protein [Streptosporangium sp. KLBMP 9127]
MEIGSTLLLIGRVTGRPLDHAWLEAEHRRYVIPSSARPVWAPDPPGGLLSGEL